MKTLLFFLLISCSTFSVAQYEPTVNLDNLEFYKTQLQWNFKDEPDFSKKCREIIKYDGGYEYILDNIDRQPRHPETHEYFLGYLSCFLKNKNELFINLLKDRIDRNLINKHTMNNTIFRMFDNNSNACNYINSLVENENLSADERNEIRLKVNYLKSCKLYQDTCK